MDDNAKVFEQGGIIMIKVFCFVIKRRNGETVNALVKRTKGQNLPTVGQMFDVEREYGGTCINCFALMADEN